MISNKLVDREQNDSKRNSFFVPTKHSEEHENIRDRHRHARAGDGAPFFVYQLHLVFSFGVSRVFRG
jgi:hypothetical protein